MNARLGILDDPLAAQGRRPVPEQARPERFTAEDPVDAVDHFLNLSEGGRDIGVLDRLSDEGLEQTLSMLVTLFRQGVVGFEMLERRGEAYKSFIATRPAAPELRGARVLDNSSRRPRRVDLYA